ncbi:hypothetical protein R84981_003004 [Carnimonas sp. R-84981]|uniref:hypothetical protein n=1 Tax=Carnimonas bestiolae TaxID=3402172 RepID=UPI003EDC7D3D
MHEYRVWHTGNGGGPQDLLRIKAPDHESAAIEYVRRYENADADYSVASGDVHMPVNVEGGNEQKTFIVMGDLNPRYMAKEAASEQS